MKWKVEIEIDNSLVYGKIVFNRQKSGSLFGSFEAPSLKDTETVLQSIVSDFRNGTGWRVVRIQATNVDRPRSDDLDLAPRLIQLNRHEIDHEYVEAWSESTWSQKSSQWTWATHRLTGPAHINKYGEHWFISGDQVKDASRLIAQQETIGEYIQCRRDVDVVLQLREANVISLLPEEEENLKLMRDALAD